MFKPGDKVRRKPEYQCDEWWNLGDRVLTVSGNSPVHPCDILLDGHSGVGTWSDGAQSSVVRRLLADGRSVLVRDGKIVTPNA